MSAKAFLESVLGDTGYYCAFGFDVRDGRRVQKFYDSIDALLHTAHAMDDDGIDAYFALATFNIAGSRKAANAKQLRSFFLDLDCGEEKYLAGDGYRTKGDALAALRTFCKNHGFPKPTLIDSGRGIHAYWSLTTPVDADEWVPQAERFKALCLSAKLVIDPAVPADSARVLRVPGTRNFKDDPPHDVVMLGDPTPPVEFSAFCALLGAMPAPVRRTDTSALGEDSLMQALVGNYTNRFKTILIKTAEGVGCAQIGELVSNQAGVSEPLWRAGLSIAKFCVDGDKAIHRISNKHPDYDFDATEAKAGQIKGPYHCTKFNEFRPGCCTDCKHWGKIKSPIVLGREVEEAPAEEVVVTQQPIGLSHATPITYTIPKYPAPYFRGKNGGVFKKGKDEDDQPKDVMVYINDLYVVRRLKDPELGEALVMRLHLPKDGVREFTLPLTAVGTKDEFRKHLAQQGVAVINVTELMEYTMRWVNELQFTAEANEARRQFGWTGPDCKSFAIGNMEVFADRIEVNSPSSATVGMFPIFQARGDYSAWLEVMEFYNREGLEQHQFMIGLAYGAPLMEFMPIHAAAVHVFSKTSGLGKTTAMNVGASVYGDPGLLVIQEKDTMNTKMNRAEVYKNLPVYMDEMTNTRPADLSDFAYQLTSGMQRNRLSGKGNVERVRGMPWKTLFGTTGNTSMLERISLYKALAQAEAQRILESRAVPFPFQSKEETDQHSAKIKANFGHAGVPYLQYVMQNLPAVRQLLETNQRKLDEAAGLKAENRFWSAAAACILTGLMLAKKLGQHRWNIAPIAQWVVKEMKSNKTNVAEMATDVEAILTNYIAENYNNILRIKSTDDARKVTGMEQLIQPEAIPRNTFVARYEYDVKKMYLLPKPLKEWCGKQQINYAGFIEGLREGRTKAGRQKIRLTRGTHVAMPPTDVLVVDCSGFMDDETDEPMAADPALFQKSGT